MRVWQFEQVYIICKYQSNKRPITCAMPQMMLHYVSDKTPQFSMMRKKDRVLPHYIKFHEMKVFLLMNCIRSVGYILDERFILFFSYEMSYILPAQ